MLLKDGLGELMLTHGSIPSLVNVDDRGLAGAADIVGEADARVALPPVARPPHPATDARFPLPGPRPMRRQDAL